MAFCGQQPIISFTSQCTKRGRGSAELSEGDNSDPEGNIPQQASGVPKEEKTPEACEPKALSKTHKKKKSVRKTAKSGLKKVAKKTQTESGVCPPSPPQPLTPTEADTPENKGLIDPSTGLNWKVEKFGSLIEGYGLRAREPLKAGDIVWQGPSPWDRPYPVTEIKTWSKPKWKEWRHYLYQVGDDLWGPKNLADVDLDMANYINHSCEPNIWFDGPFCHVAKRDIPAGEEICYDYGTENLEDDDFKCLCNKSTCRGVITKDDYKLKGLQESHGSHMSPHVWKLVQAIQAQEKAEQEGGPKAATTAPKNAKKAGGSKKKGSK